MSYVIKQQRLRGGNLPRSGLLEPVVSLGWWEATKLLKLRLFYYDLLPSKPAAG